MISKRMVLLENLLRTLLRSVLLHDPLGVHPIVLFGTFPIFFSGFSRFVRGLSGIFPICPSPLPRAASY